MISYERTVTIFINTVTAFCFPMSPPPGARASLNLPIYQEEPLPHRQDATAGVGGVAYGGFARKTVGRALDLLPGDGTGRVEEHPRVLAAALEQAFRLVGGLKQPP